MRGIRIVKVFFLVLMLLLAGQLVLYAAFHYRRLFDNDYNSRTRLLSGQNRRGTIYSSDGYVLAETRTDADGTDRRVYPFGNVFSHIVGYSANGGSGIEDLQDYYLVRSDISVFHKADYEEQGMKFPGNTVQTTLHAGLQCAAADAMEGYRGAVIITEPATGRILACVSRPDFDPNTIAAKWQEITSDTESGQLVNRAFQGTYPPGSTFKIIDAAAFWEQDAEGAENYRYTCTGTFTAGDETIRCYGGDIHGPLDFTDSFVRSCNCSFANIGLLLDRNRTAAMMKRMYFDRALPFDLPSSTSRAIPDRDCTDADRIQLAIGQGTAVMSPLHMNMITAAVANDGVMMKPYVTDAVLTADGDDIRVFHPSEAGRVFSSRTAQKLSAMMEETVLSGTARGLRSDGWTAAGKTGSAEYSDDPSLSHAWFTGYAPAESPEICITVILEGAGSGAQAAVPAARKILDAWFDMQ